MAGWPGWIAVPAELAAGVIAGASLAGIAAVLRRRFGVLEVISTLMLNFVALFMVSYIVRGPLQEPTHTYPQTLGARCICAAAGHHSRAAPSRRVRRGDRARGHHLVVHAFNRLRFPYSRGRRRCFGGCQRRTRAMWAGWFRCLSRERWTRRPRRRGPSGGRDVRAVRGHFSGIWIHGNRCRTSCAAEPDRGDRRWNLLRRRSRQVVPACSATQACPRGSSA